MAIYYPQSLPKDCICYLMKFMSLFDDIDNNLYYTNHIAYREIIFNGDIWKYTYEILKTDPRLLSYIMMHQVHPCIGFYMICNGIEYQIVGTAIPTKTCSSRAIDIMTNRQSRNPITQIWVKSNNTPMTTIELTLIDNKWKQLEPSDDNKNDSEFYFGSVDTRGAISLLPHKHYNRAGLSNMLFGKYTCVRSFYLEMDKSGQFRFVPHQTYVPIDIYNLELTDYYSVMITSNTTDSKLIVFSFEKSYYHIKPQAYENPSIQKFGQFVDLDEILLSNSNKGRNKTLQFSISIYTGNFDSLMAYRHHDSRLTIDMICNATVL